MESHGPGDVARKNLRLHSVAVHHIQECHGTLPLSRFFETTSRGGPEESLVTFHQTFQLYGYGKGYTGTPKFLAGFFLVRETSILAT